MAQFLIKTVGNGYTTDVATIDADRFTEHDGFAKFYVTETVMQEDVLVAVVNLHIVFSIERVKPDHVNDKPNFASDMASFVDTANNIKAVLRKQLDERRRSGGKF